eukprot:TRINITY_DN8832_c0_g1_i2.p1 TRINITY_DN8832_c0_g1~~TRINITY_DN8832_c0_g1_i2.p1  ORF type:complete len:180 (+),score=42.32 TRINITY_DN8832_c0_g1_i2:55-540(+)
MARFASGMIVGQRGSQLARHTCRATSKKDISTDGALIGLQHMAITDRCSETHWDVPAVRCLVSIPLPVSELRSNNSRPFARLCGNVLTCIAVFLPAKDLQNFSVLNAACRDAADQDLIWEPVFEAMFPIAYRAMEACEQPSFKAAILENVEIFGLRDMLQW